ncbi:peptidase S41 family protein [Delitschia confertaspora ATCC 74209]|uniref:Peptidase S41 family protein n=1 Tax=Delitschia confertaspora ATCC 74209 TaxID=1513339 RepID=A0A9P4JKI2_9PLEO|nr:peptidase S41 family protein [Delitschia confertaspora ATCC 74209]
MTPYRIVALSALFFSIAVAQFETDVRTQIPEITDVRTQSRTLIPTGDIQPSTTKTASGPIKTSEACSMISNLVKEDFSEFASVQADLAYACLQSVPFEPIVASSVVASLKQMVQFQSTLVYLKSPPKSFANEGVDILKGLDDIKSKISREEYEGEYEFEADIANLFVKAYDGHLGFDGMVYSGAFRWQRSKQIALISASQDGGLPKIWAINDFNETRASFTPSPVTKIDGKDAIQFLQEESDRSSYHDPDTRFNTMFYQAPADSYGYFTNPKNYPGPVVNVTFENGTTHTYINSAVILDVDIWSDITDGESFYEMYVSLRSRYSDRLKKRSPHAPPHNLQHPKELRRSKQGTIASSPIHYPQPFNVHGDPDVPLAGYFINTPVGEVGVLMIQTFNPDSNTGAARFQTLIEKFLDECRTRSTKKSIIDVRTNGGGRILLGYEVFKQFFPDQEPQLQSRYRGHNASEIFGDTLSSYITLSSRNGQAFTSPFNYNSYVSKDGEKFKSWKEMYPPESFNNDHFTSLLKYNLSDPLTTTSETYALGLTITGYLDRANPAPGPFSKDDIIILSDGICASTCSLFLELMVQQAGVRTITVGGRPQNGPMQPVGGTKGSMVLQYSYLALIGRYVVSNFAKTSSVARQWAQSLPTTDFPINYNDASVNFQDNIRHGFEGEGLPTQFVNDTSACRIWYKPEMYINVTSLWTEVAETVWGNDGKMDEKRCVAGSVTSVEQQKGQNQGNGMPSAGAPKPTKSKGAAAPIALASSNVWKPVLMCVGVVIVSMGFGAGLVV